MQNLMLVSVLVTGTLIVGGVLAVLIHGAWLHRQVRRERRVIGPIRSRLLDSLGDPFEPEEGCAALRRLRRREWARVIVELAPAVEGESRARLGQVAELAGVVEASVAACHARRSSVRLLGARLMAVLGADAPVMRTLLGDQVPQVRAQAAEWATDHPHHEVIDRLVDLLADHVPLPRFSAHDALVRIGQPAVTVVLARLSTLPARARPIALSVARSLPDPRFREVAVYASRDIDAQVRSAACELLRVLALPDTEADLVARLADESPLVRASAARALAVVSPRAAANHLPSMLRDPEFDVRRIAAHALRASGSLGSLLLRRVTEGDDRYAADMARQTLALPQELLRR